MSIPITCRSISECCTKSSYSSHTCPIRNELLQLSRLLGCYHNYTDNNGVITTCGQAMPMILSVLMISMHVKTSAPRLKLPIMIHDVVRASKTQVCFLFIHL